MHLQKRTLLYSACTMVVFLKVLPTHVSHMVSSSQSLPYGNLLAGSNTGETLHG